MDISGERDLKKVLKRLIIFGDQNRSLQDILLVYVFFSMVILVSISAIINILIGISTKVIFFDFVVILGFIILYISTNVSSRYKLIRGIFISFTYLSISFLWINSQGSSGPGILLLESLAVVLIFTSTGKEFLVYFLSLIAITITLYLIEFYNAEVIVKYESRGQKILDNLSMVLLIFAFQIPVLIYARNILFKEREEALSNAEAKSCFLAQMSHEIRTPMNAILGFVELLEDPNIEKEEHSSYLKIISQNSRILLNLLNNAININKINAGQTQVFLSKNNANTIIEYVTENLNALNANTDVLVKFEKSTVVDPIFETDDNLLFQILINIGYNALKFTKSGCVSLGWVKDVDSIIFSIKDTGCGIADNDQIDLFDKYVQTQNVGVMTPMNGAGLGLHICKKISELLKGEIKVTSKVGIGSEFLIKLPISHK